jgi:oligopeptide transport system substrate-binding protein
MSYWNAEGVKLDAAELIPVEPSAAIRMFQRGELDVVFGLPAEAASKLDGDPRLFGSATQAVYYFVLNTTSPALRDVRVRRALAAALDREAVVAAHPGARNLVAHRVVPPGMIGYTAPDVQLSGDPAAARRLAEAALDQEGRRGTLRLIFNASDTHRRVASIAASGWSERLGLSVRPVALEWLQYLRSRRTGEYEIARWGWVPDYVDPAAFLELWTSDSSENDTNWANARYDRLLSMARQSLALPAERMRLLAEAEAILLREVPVIPVFYYSRAALVAVRVRGFHTRVTDPDSVGVTNPMGWNPLQAMSLVE